MYTYEFYAPTPATLGEMSWQRPTLTFSTWYEAVEAAAKIALMGYKTRIVQLDYTPLT